MVPAASSEFGGYPFTLESDYMERKDMIGHLSEGSYGMDDRAIIGP